WTMRTITNGHAQSAPPGRVHYRGVSRAEQVEWPGTRRQAGCGRLDPESHSHRRKWHQPRDGITAFEGAGSFARKLACDAIQLRSMAGEAACEARQCRQGQAHGGLTGACKRRTRAARSCAPEARRKDFPDTAMVLMTRQAPFPGQKRRC